MSDLPRAVALIEMNRPAQAVPFAARAIGDDPDSVSARHALLSALIGCGRSRDAVAHGRAALGMFPADPWLHHQMAVAYLMQENLASAIPHSRKALEGLPEDPLVHAVLAKALSRAGDRRLACHHVQQAIELQPDDPFVHQAEGDVWVEAKEWTKGEAAYRRALELDPQDSVTLTNLGFVLKKQKKGDAALEYSLAAARAEPTNTVATTNVVNFGRGALVGGGIALFLAVRLASAVYSGSVEWKIAGLFGAVLLMGWAGSRYLRFRQLPEPVQHALRAQRRVEGPGSMSLWLGLTYAGVSSLGWALGRSIEGATTTGTWFVAAAGSVAAVLSLWRVVRKIPHRSVHAIIGPHLVWIILTVLGAVWVLGWFAVSQEGPRGLRGTAMWLSVSAVPIMYTCWFIAHVKHTTPRPSDWQNV